MIFCLTTTLNLCFEPKKACVIVGREKNRSCWRQQTLHRVWCSAAWRSRRCTIPTIQLNPMALKTYWYNTHCPRAPPPTHYTRARPTTQTNESRFACSLTPQGYKSINTLHTLHFLIGWNLNSTPFCNVCVAVRWEVGSFHSMAAKSGTTTLDESWFSEFHVWELALPSWQVLK